MNEGWICPICGKVMAPFTMECLYNTSHTNMIVNDVDKPIKAPRSMIEQLEEQVLKEQKKKEQWHNNKAKTGDLIRFADGTVDIKR